LQSALGKGTTFWFTIQVPYTDKENKKLLLKAPLNNINVLIVDDSKINLLVLQEILANKNFNVHSATNVDDGVALLKSNIKIDIALVDFMMPDKNGIEFINIVKSDSTIKNIPSIMISSAAQRGDAKRAKENGFVAFLTKPVRQQHLLECMSSVLGYASIDEERFITKYTIKEESVTDANILLVEDNKVNQMVALALLKSFGVTVTVANDGLEAYEAVQKNNYQLILMDCQMPVMDGFESTKKIRAFQSKEKLDPVPILALTANAMEGDRETCLAAGMNDFLTKPIHKETLHEAIKQWLK